MKKMNNAEMKAVNGGIFTYYKEGCNHCGQVFYKKWVYSYSGLNKALTDGWAAQKKHIANSQVGCKSWDCYIWF